MAFVPEDDIQLLGFFNNQESLRTIDIQFQKRVDIDTLKTVLFQILSSCCHLCQLECLWDRIWLHRLSQTEFTRLRALTSTLENMKVDGFVFDPQRSSLSLENCELWSEPNDKERIYFEQSSVLFFRNFPDLQHLNLKCMVTDYTLQRIFEYLVRSLFNFRLVRC